DRTAEDILEDLVGEVDLAVGLAVDVGDLDLHDRDSLSGRFGFALEGGRLRRLLRQSTLHGVLHQDVGAFMAGDRALHVDQALIGVRLDDLQVLLRDALDAQMAGHLLAREGTARILAVTGRTVRAVRDRDAVGGAKTAEIPALHRTGEALADR